MNEYDSKADTLEHIRKVNNYLNEVVRLLLIRAATHDESKLHSLEKELFDEWTPKLAALTYGSEEYYQTLEHLKPALRHHYVCNDHHPNFVELHELWKDVIGYEDTYEISSLGKIRSKDR